MATEVISINRMGGTDGRGCVTLRNLPEGEPFNVTAATLRQMANQGGRSSDDRYRLKMALTELDLMNSTKWYGLYDDENLLAVEAFSFDPLPIHFKYNLNDHFGTSAQYVKEVVVAKVE